MGQFHRLEPWDGLVYRGRGHCGISGCVGVVIVFADAEEVVVVGHHHAVAAAAVVVVVGIVVVLGLEEQGLLRGTESLSVLIRGLLRIGVLKKQGRSLNGPRMLKKRPDSESAAQVTYRFRGCDWPH